MVLIRFLMLIYVAMTLSGCLATAVVGGAATIGNAANDERTVGRQFDDALIASAIDARLIAERDMPSRWVSVEVVKGQVTLLGHLPTAIHIERAIFITKQIHGVIKVENRLIVGKPKIRAVMSDSWITMNIKRLLWNDKAVSGFKISVETIGGKVYLQGVVNSLVERARAKEIARKTPGVSAVIDLMRSGGS